MIRRVLPVMLTGALLLTALFPLSRAAVGAAAARDTVYVDPASGTGPIVSFIDAAKHTLDGAIYLVSVRHVAHISQVR